MGVAISGRRPASFFLTLVVGCTFACSSPPLAVAKPSPSQNAIAANSFCTVAQPSIWKQAFSRGEIATGAGESMIPFAISSTSGSLFASDYSPAWYGVVVYDGATGVRTRVAVLPPDDQVLAGAFDGRWLVWTELHSQTTYFDWTLYAWDSKTNRVVRLADAARQNGELITGPVAWPVVKDGVASWSQAISSSVSELHLYLLSTSQDRVIATGTVSDPVFVGSWLVWDHLDAIGKRSVLAFADARTGQSTTGPSALLNVLNPTMLVGNGQSLAWASSGLQELWVWRTAWKAPMRMIGSPNSEYAEYPNIAGDIVTFDGVSGAWAADLRSSSITKLSPEAGSVVAGGVSVAYYVAAPSTVKSSHPGLRVFLTEVRLLPPLPHTGSSCP